MDRGLHLSPGCKVAETGEVVRRVVMKEEDIKVEQYDYIIACRDEDKLFTDLHCKIETDVTEDWNITYKEETYFAECKTETHTESDSDETQTVKIEEKIEEAELASHVGSSKLLVQLEEGN